MARGKSAFKPKQTAEQRLDELEQRIDAIEQRLGMNLLARRPIRVSDLNLGGGGLIQTPSTQPSETQPPQRPRRRTT